MNPVRLLEFNRVPSAPWLTVELAARELSCLSGEPVLDPEEQPAYPGGTVNGPCVCGSWPGGPCLRCEWRPGTEVGGSTPYRELMLLIADEDRGRYCSPWGDE